MTDKPHCREIVSDSRRSWRCDNPGIVERAGKWYCGIHDPERLAKIRAAHAARYDAVAVRREARDRVTRAERDLIAAVLGVDAKILPPWIRAAMETLLLRRAELDALSK